MNIYKVSSTGEYTVLDNCTVTTRFGMSDAQVKSLAKSRYFLGESTSYITHVGLTQHISPVSSSWADTMSVIMWDSTKAKSGIFTPCSGVNTGEHLVGAVDLDFSTPYSGTSTTRGTLNISESSLTKLGGNVKGRYVIDFPTHSANGTIDRISFLDGFAYQSIGSDIMVNREGAGLRFTMDDLITVLPTSAEYTRLILLEISPTEALLFYTPKATLNRATESIQVVGYKDGKRYNGSIPATLIYSDKHSSTVEFNRIISSFFRLATDDPQTFRAVTYPAHTNRKHSIINYTFTESGTVEFESIHVDEGEFSTVPLYNKTYTVQGGGGERSFTLTTNTNYYMTGLIDVGNYYIMVCDVYDKITTSGSFYIKLAFVRLDKELNLIDGISSSTIYKNNTNTTSYYTISYHIDGDFIALNTTASYTIYNHVTGEIHAGGAFSTKHTTGSATQNFWVSHAGTQSGYGTGGSALFGTKKLKLPIIDVVLTEPLIKTDTETLKLVFDIDFEIA